jgi:putative lipoic acid-binding regulatory protein
LSEQDRQRAIDLLEANHVFPGPFSVSVIALNSDTVTAAVLGAARVGPESDSATAGHETRSSSAGKYLSHRLTVQVASAADVLDLYARVRAVEGVITVL